MAERKTASKRAVPVVARLRSAGTELLLPPGDYIVGRDTDCDVVIDDALVSRRHAMIRIGERVTVSDLGSSNGVWVGGERVGQAPLAVAEGEPIVIGGERIDLVAAADSAEDDAPSTAVGGSIAPRPVTDPAVQRAARRASEGPAPARKTTSRVSAVELMGLVADKALAEGRGKYAEDVLTKHLFDLLEAARGKQKLPEAALAAGFRYALRLARATSKPRWTEYAIELWTAQSALLTEELTRDLIETVKLTGRIDEKVLDRYSMAVRKLVASYERVRSLQCIDEMRRISRASKPPP
jgi:hypothetical protein